MDLSIVVPLFNEEDSVHPLCEAIRESVDPLGYPLEVLLVDDGSTDDTYERACEEARCDSRIGVVKLRKNFGQTAALHAGFVHAQGDIIITMDGDLQNDPTDIERLVRKMQEGYDVVTGWREKRQDRFLYRKLPSRIANWLIRKVTEASIIDNGCALRAYRADIIKRFPLYSEMHRLLPTILSMAGVQIAQIRVRHHPRKYGESKYGLARVYKVLFDLLAINTVMTSAQLPLFGFGFFAVLFAGFGMFSLLAGLSHLTLQPETAIVIYLGASMLWGMLSISLLMLGVLCSLIYARGNFKVEDVLRVEAL